MQVLILFMSFTSFAGIEPVVVATLRCCYGKDAASFPRERPPRSEYKETETLRGAAYIIGVFAVLCLLKDREGHL